MSDWSEITNKSRTRTKEGGVGPRARVEHNFVADFVALFAIRRFGGAPTGGTFWGARGVITGDGVSGQRAPVCL
jgi:hypothetical protein